MTIFKVMTWNVGNLFRPVLGACEADQWLFQQKIQLLAGVISPLDPDVVALQEIGSEEPP